MNDCCHFFLFQHGCNCPVCLLIVFEKMYAHFLYPSQRYETGGSLISQIVLICEMGTGNVHEIKD